MPKNNAEFVKTWKNLHSSKEKLSYCTFLANLAESEGKGDQVGVDSLKESTKSTLARICAEEFPPEIFPELIKCIYDDIATVTMDDMVFNEHSKFDDECEKVRSERWKDILRILYIVGQTKR